MRLYHGTSEWAAKQALKVGLKPRGTSGRNNWKHSVPSNPKCVYLTDIYGPYFAMCATREGSKAAILEVETDELDFELLWPDEDFLEQATHGKDNVPGDMKTRTLYYRKRAKDYPGGWHLSIKHLGTCAYAGVIPPSAITRVVYWDYKKTPMIAAAACDPSIVILNHKFCAPKYAAITRWLFGAEITPAEYWGYGEEIFKAAGGATQEAALRDMLSQREGLEVVLL
jgi:hypothetical protein